MLGKPMHGWAEVRCGEVLLGAASYLTDVPMECLDAFITYFSQEEKSLNFCIQFDAEGYEFGIVEFSFALYSVDTKTNDDHPNMREICPEALGLNQSSTPSEILIHLGNELLEDIVLYIDDWVEWFWYEDDEGEEKKSRRSLLLSKCKDLNVLLEKERLHA